jgi:hypothetical protein
MKMTPGRRSKPDSGCSNMFKAPFDLDQAFMRSSAQNP